MVRGESPGPAPAAQARANNWRSRGRVDGHAPTGMRRKADGALTTQPRTPSPTSAQRMGCSRRLPARKTSQRPQCSPVPALRRGQGDGRRVPAGPGAGLGWPAGAGRHWPPGMVVKEDADTRVCLWQIYWVLLVSGRGSKTIIPDSEEHPLASSRAVPKDVLRWIRA